MKKEIKTKCVLKNPNTINVNDINFELKDNVELSEGVHPLSVQLDIMGISIKLKETELDEIISIVDKIDKYQRNDMSEKEVQKMIRKLDKYPMLEPIVQKMNKMEALDPTELLLLNAGKKSSEFVPVVVTSKVEVLNIEIEGAEVIIEKNIEEFKEMLIQDFIRESNSVENQEILENMFDDQERIRLSELTMKINEIMGRDVKPKNKSTKEEKRNKVDDYLLEKQKMIVANAESSYHVDIEFPLPQANNLERVISLGNEIFNKGESKINLEVLEHDLDKRDVHYYSRSLCYLKLAKIDESTRDLCLTYEGEKFFKSAEEERKDIIFSILNTDPLVKMIIENNIDLNNPDHKKEFESRGLSSDSTIARRISSLKSWITYLAN